MISERVINMKHLKQSNYLISDIFMAQNLKLFLNVCGIEVFEDPVHLFYANLYFSKDCGELKTLVLGSRIQLNDFLFNKVFGIDSIGGILYFNSV